MASTRLVGSKKEITIRNNVFGTVEEAIEYYDIVTTQFYQVKTYFTIDEPHKVLMTCLNFGINRNIHNSVNLSKYLEFMKTRINSLTELWIRSDSTALRDFLKMEETTRMRKIAERISNDPSFPVEKSEEEVEMSVVNNAQPGMDFSSFNGEQDFNKIGMQFVLASNIKALKGFIDILQEVSFPIPDDKVIQVHGDLQPIKKMVDDSMTIIENLIGEGKAY